MRTRSWLILPAALCVSVVLGASTPGAQRATTPAAADPLVTLETPKGAIELRLFRSDAPKSVEKILALIARNFYRGQRIHRVENSLVQFGDPTSRDVSRKDWWGRMGSGVPVGVAEFSKRTHIRGAVGLAHGGDPKFADSQIYILKTASPSLNGKHVVIGQVTRGIEVVDRLQVADLIKAITVKP